VCLKIKSYLDLRKKETAIAYKIPDAFVIIV